MGNLQMNTKLVVVDDDVVIQDLLIAYFKPRGYDVAVFSNAESALNESRNLSSKWDILISDQELPEMTGLQFVVTLKKYRPELPVIFATSVNSVETAVEAISRGACDFIIKPIHLPQLHISIERALHSSRIEQNLIELKEYIKKDCKQSEFLIGESPKLIATINIAKKVASSYSSIFISGESGSGKEVFARYIHAESNRAKGPFIAINCSAIPENLLESELFGHAKGAFTGAIDNKKGLFEEAENGTLFLDEIGDLSLNLQAKLLRVLQERKIKRVGENEFRSINARIISATHKNITEEIEQNRFREDLFFRLNVIPIHIPSLRERTEDILPLAEYFLNKYTLVNNFSAKEFSDEAKVFLIENTWKGNVRELENSIERAVVMCTTTTIQLSDFLIYSSEEGLLNSESVGLSATEAESGVQIFRLKVQKTLPELQEVVQKYIEFAVSRNGGAKDRTAKEIGIDRKTLYRKMKNFEHYVQ